MQLLNETLDQAPLRFEVQYGESGFSSKRTTGGSEFATVLGPVAWSAAELLTSENLERIKRCVDDTCGWLFLDNTKNRSRRWCDMGDCGSRAKAKRYYHRKTKK
jgi:predicted RNA-binding Zn ribbon-like protein